MKQQDKNTYKIQQQKHMRTNTNTNTNIQTNIYCMLKNKTKQKRQKTTVYAKAQSKKPLFKNALLIGTIQSRQKETITIRFNRIEFSDKTSGSISAYATVESTYHAQHAEKIINTITKTATSILTAQVQNSAGLIMGQSQDIIPVVNEVSYNTISQGTLIDIVFDRTQIVAKN